MSRYQIAVLVGLLASVASAFAEPEGVRRVKVLNYPDCIELSNGETVVTLCHQVGGRVLQYRWKQREALYLDPNEAKWGTDEAPAQPNASAGRFDIGPELLIPQRDVLWSGEWTAEPIGPRSARLTSKKDAATGVQLVREFRLAEKGTHLACKQIIRNVSDTTRRWSHWSRTFSRGGGIVVIPLTPEKSRFPNQYVMYEQGHVINFRPEDPMIRRRGNFLEVLGPGRRPKLGMDSFAGWFGYLLPDDLLFVKSYAADPKRVYGEVASLTISIWKPRHGRMCELEPIGPIEEIAPGGEASFTEHWRLLNHPFPGEGESIDLQTLETKVKHASK